MNQTNQVEILMETTEKVKRSPESAERVLYAQNIMANHPFEVKVAI